MFSHDIGTARQFVLTGTGLTSMFLVPFPRYFEGVISIDIPTKTTPLRGSSEAWHKKGRTFEEAEGSVIDVLGRSGGVRGLTTFSNTFIHQTRPDIFLLASNLKFYIFSKLEGLKLYFVDSMCIDFDNTIIIYHIPILRLKAEEASTKRSWLGIFSLPHAL